MHDTSHRAELVDLELFLMWRARGMVFEAPAVQNRVDASEWTQKPSSPCLIQ